MSDLETVFDLISDADPAGRVLIPADFLVTEADLESLLQQGGEVGEGWDGGAGAPPSQPVPARSPRRRPWRLGIAIGAVAVVAAVIAVVGVEDGPGSPQSAAAALHEAAGVALAQPELAPGQVIYIRSEDSYMTSVITSIPEKVSEEAKRTHTAIDPMAIGAYYAYQGDSTREIWKGDNAGRVVSTGGDTRFLNERNEQAWIDEGRPNLHEDYGKDVTPLPPTSAKDLRLQADPEALYASLAEEARKYGQPGETVSDFVFDEVLNDLIESVASPQERAALFEAAARIPDVEIDEDAVDERGRTGIGIIHRSDFSHSISEFVFDPGTAQMLETSEVATEGNLYGDPGDLVGHAIFDAPVVVDKVGDRPEP